MKTLAAVAFAMFTLAAAGEPVLSSITPAAGSISGGDYVHIHGSDLQLASKVTFGGTDAQIVIVSDREIVAITPPHAAGAVDVQVGLATFANGYRYEDPLPSDMVRFIAPIVVNAPGALGSNWVSELRVTNGSIENLNIAGTTIAPQFAKTITLTPSIGAGGFFFVPKRLASRVTASLRVHDTSRDAESFGTEIPVVPDTQFRASVLIPNVPSDARFRSLLRVYCPFSGSINVTILTRDDDTGTPLAEQDVTMDSYAQVAIDPPVGRLRVRLEITSKSLLPIWAFVAVTNNTTQQVTTILPSQITAPAPVSALAIGHWAGGGICMNVSETSVTLSNGCGGFSFSRPLALENGRFEADGFFLPGGGPPPIDLTPLQPAHFSGVVQGDDLMLTITGAHTPALTYHVTLGSTAPCAPPCP